MNTEIVSAIFDMIGDEEWKQIKTIMKNSGATCNGYANFEKVPTQLIKQSCVNQEKIRNKFLEAVVQTYINEEAVNSDDIPPINNENFIGVVSLMLLKNVDISTIQNAINEMNELSQSENINEEIQTKKSKNEGNKMKTYLGYMDGLEGQYYNFYPVYQFINSNFVKIEQPEVQFPVHGNLAIHTHNFKKKEEAIKNKEFCIINFDETDIIKNINEYTRELKPANYKIYIDDLEKDKKLLPLNTYNIYPIVTPAEQEIDFSKKTIIDVKESFPVFKYMTRSILYYKGAYYGPFKTGFREHNRMVYIDTKLDENNYLIDKYTDGISSDDPVLYCNFSKSEDYQDFLVLDSASLTKETIDFASEDVLISTFTELLKSKINSKEIRLEELPELFGKIKSSPFIDIPKHPEISSKRLERFTNIFSDFNRINELTKSTSSLVQNMFINMDSNEQNAVVDTIVNNPEFITKIQRYKVVASQIEAKEKELEDLQSKCDQLQKDINSQRDNIRENVLDEKHLELENLNNEISNKQNELDEIKQKLGITIEYTELSNRNKSLNALNLDLTNEINEKIEKAKKGVTNLLFNDQFDNMISIKMSEVFSENQRNEEAKLYNTIANELAILPVKNIDSNELISTLVAEVQKYRPKYDRNTILNIAICITQGFLTILSGEPGTGKTSICEIFAHILGLDRPIYEGNDSVFTNRFSAISVERGWNSKRDLIGYYNPLSKRIEKSNGDLYDALRILNAEEDKSKYPMVILLDEANLSPMEYYWADFVKICDDINKKTLNRIDLGDGQKIVIPSTLRFLATINNDHTTEKISPRLTDRAFVISLPTEHSDNVKKDFDDKFEIVSWESLEKAFASTDKPMDSQTKLTLEKIKNIFIKMGQPISPRVENAITSYCSVAQEVFEGNDVVTSSFIALDYAVAQKLATKIIGSGEKYHDTLIELNELCKKENLNLTVKQLERIIERGSDMDYYEYFC